jgi:hypothetical protein
MGPFNKQSAKALKRLREVWQAAEKGFGWGLGGQH